MTKSQTYKLFVQIILISNFENIKSKICAYLINESLLLFKPTKQQMKVEIMLLRI